MQHWIRWRRIGDCCLWRFPSVSSSTVACDVFVQSPRLLTDCCLWRFHSVSFVSQSLLLFFHWVLPLFVICVNVCLPSTLGLVFTLVQLAVLGLSPPSPPFSFNFWLLFCAFFFVVCLIVHDVVAEISWCALFVLLSVFVFMCLFCIFM